jgi:hypothetical protein
MKAMGIKVVGVGRGQAGLEHFLEEKHWTEEATLVVDDDGDVFKALGCGKEGTWRDMVSVATIRAALSLKNSTDFSQVTGGPWFTFGGTFIITGRGRVVLEHRQKDFVESVCGWEIMKACYEADAEKSKAGEGDASSKVFMASAGKGDPVSVRSNGSGADKPEEKKRIRARAASIRADRAAYLAEVRKMWPREAMMKPRSFANSCEHCGKKFATMGDSSWRYNCSHCGDVVCHACSKHLAVVPRCGPDPVKVCEACVYEFDGKITPETPVPTMM